MSPPVDPQKSETVDHAVEALRRSDRPLTGREILKLIPPPSRVEARAMEELLERAAAEKRLNAWPANRAGEPRYWTRSAEDAAEAGLLKVLADAALSAGALLKKLARYLPGINETGRRAAMAQRLTALLQAGKLYRYPPRGKYSGRPADAATYVRGLRKQLDKLARELAPAGVTREQILEALREARAPGLPHRILEHLKAKPGTMGVLRLRDELGLTPADKVAFDEAVVGLYRARQVYLDRHDFPQGLSDRERDQLVTDGAGNYFVVIGLEDRDVEPVP